MPKQRSSSRPRDGASTTIPSSAEVANAIAVIEMMKSASEDGYVKAYTTLRDAGYINILPHKYRVGLAKFIELGLIKPNNSGGKNAIRN